MDLSKLVQQDKEAEVNVKALLELSTTKLKLEKELESLRSLFITKGKEVKLLEKQVVSLRIEVPILEKQEEVVKEMLRGLIEQKVVTNAAVEKHQIFVFLRLKEHVWGKIDSFVSDAKSMMHAWEKKEDIYQPTKSSEKIKRHDRLQILSLESEIEAMEQYTKYQGNRIRELKLVRELVGQGEDHE